MTSQASNQLCDALYDLMTPSGVNIFAKRGPYIINTHGTEVKKLVERIQLLGNWDVYACLNPARTTSGKPAIADITSVRWFMVDLDPIEGFNFDLHTAPVESAATTVTNWLESEVGCVPASLRINFTGRGFQIWVPVVETTDTARAQAAIKGCIAALAQDLPAESGFKVDTTSGEISRIARLPGTVNSKTGMMARTLFRCGEGALISVDALDKFAVMQYSVPSQPPLEGANHDQILTALSPWSREFYLHGVASSVTSRHGRGYALLQELKNLGVARNFAHQMLIYGCHRCKPPITDTDWMYRAASNVYGAA